MNTNHRILLGFLALALTGGCASGPTQQATTSAAPAPYMRVAHPDSDTVQLQIAVRQFRPARKAGPSVWLAGAAHIGESNYFAALQRHLDAQTLVLFEGVGEHPRKPRRSGKAATTAAAGPPEVGRLSTNDESTGTSLQLTMARSLGLAFQLQAIDYDRPHFLNSDLSLGQLQALMDPAAAKSTRRGTNGVPADNALNDLVRAMDGSSVFGAVANALLQIVGRSPKLQAMTKLALIEVFGAIEGDMAQLQGVTPELKQLLEVLIVERNKVVIQDLKAELKTARKSDAIAIFYGAAHLPDLEQRLRKELHYAPAEDLWLPVFSVNTTRAGLSNFELTLMRSIIRSQLAPLTQ